MNEGPLTLAERHAAEALSKGAEAQAMAAATVVDRETPDRLGPPLTLRMQRVFVEGPQYDGYGQGVSEKQFGLLSAMVAEENPGMSARDLEPVLARSLNRNYIGWSADDITTTLRRLMARGLARREERPRTKLRDPKWVWFATDEGTDLTVRWLDEKGYWG